MAPQLTWSSLFSRRFYAGLVLAVGALFVAMFLSEWWPIAISRDAELVAKYPFASEHAMSEGGWTYANPEVYAWTAFGTAAFALGGTILLASAIIRRSKKLLIGFVAVLALHWGLSQALSRHDWDRRPALVDRVYLPKFKWFVDHLSQWQTPEGPLLDQGYTVFTNQCGPHQRLSTGRPVP
jgi:hypothetical protein